MSTMPSSWKQSFRRIGISVLLIYLLICGVLFWLQRSLLYFPSHETADGPLEPWIEDGELIGYRYPVASPETIWLMMHGNAGQASDRDYVLQRLSTSDALYVLEYPGYGDRPGKPSEASFNAAALDAYERLAKLYPDTPLGVIGESIGSGPACTLANATRPPDKIVLLVPFDTLYRVAASRFYFLPVWLLLLDRWDNIAALSRYEGPLEIFAASRDEVIPYQHAQTLADRCPNAKLNKINCGHNDWSFNSAVKIER